MVQTSCDSVFAKIERITIKNTYIISAKTPPKISVIVYHNSIVAMDGQKNRLVEIGYYKIHIQYCGVGAEIGLIALCSCSSRCRQQQEKENV